MADNDPLHNAESVAPVERDIAALQERMAYLEARQERFEQAIRDGLMQASIASYKVSGPITPPGEVTE